MYLDYPDSTLHTSSESYINDLTVAYNKGEVIFTVDYALKCRNVTWVYRTSRDLGFVPFASERHLSIYRNPTLVCSAYLPVILSR
jgi:endo-alpha-1,4-polygalactosaminidase (GH114 family)